VVSIEECELPGVGHKFTLEETPGGQKIVVILRSDGRRELYEFHKGEANPTVSMTMSEDEAKRVAVVLLGAYSEPRIVPQPNVAVGATMLSWYQVPKIGTHPHPDHDWQGRDGAANGSAPPLLRQLSDAGLQLVGLVRAGATLSPPAKDADIRSGDLMVVLGPPRALDAFARLLRETTG
jgi:K+/H+ antiporter YhaU regulatory subunit KhtT